MPAAIFLSLLVVYLYLGLLFYQKGNLKPFIIITVLLPLTPALTVLHTKYQINAYYVFVAFPILLFLLKQYLRHKFNRNTFLVIFGLSLFTLFYLILGNFLNTDGLQWINVLKDIKPIIFLGIGFIFLDLMRDKRISWGSRFSANLLKYNFFATVLFFLILNKTNLVSIVSNDPFYILSETRYLSMGTYFVIFYLFAKLASNARFKILEIIYVFVPILLSGNRTFILVIVFVFLLNILISITNPIAFLKRVGLLVTGAIALIAIILNTNVELKNRVMSLLNSKHLISELTERRFAPFFIELEDFSWFNYLIGKGLGETLFIPWFVYRENIENYNIYMDNIYLTLYVKYGLGLIGLLFCLIYFINKTGGNKKFKILVISYFLIMGLTTSFMYQSSFLFVLIILSGLCISPINKPKAIKAQLHS